MCAPFRDDDCAAPGPRASLWTLAGTTARVQIGGCQSASNQALIHL